MTRSNGSSAWTEKQVFSTGEAAKACGISQQTIIRCFDDGRIHGFRVPGSRFRRIPRAELLVFMRRNDIPTGAYEAFSDLEKAKAYITAQGFLPAMELVDTAPDGAETEPLVIALRPAGRLVGRVVDNHESLFFPCIYQLDGQIEVLSYATVYEGAYRAGDEVVVRGVLERGDKDRVVIGSLGSHQQSMLLRS